MTQQSKCGVRGDALKPWKVMKGAWSRWLFWATIPLFLGALTGQSNYGREQTVGSASETWKVTEKQLHRWLNWATIRLFLGIMIIPSNYGTEVFSKIYFTNEMDLVDSSLRDETRLWKNATFWAVCIFLWNCWSLRRGRPELNKTEISCRDDQSSVNGAHLRDPSRITNQKPSNDNKSKEKSTFCKLFVHLLWKRILSRIKRCLSKPLLHMLEEHISNSLTKHILQILITFIWWRKWKVSWRNMGCPSIPIHIHIWSQAVKNNTSDTIFLTCNSSSITQLDERRFQKTG